MLHQGILTKLTLPTPTPTRILLLGRTGQVGSELLPRLNAFAEVIAPDRSQLDLASEDSLRSTVRSIRPAIIINAAAYTAVDRAESEPELAARINAVAPAVLAQEARNCGAFLIHYSTDYVFDGGKRTPYLEQDVPAPLNQYGRSKLAGEQDVMRVGGVYFILRTSWVYAARGSNFLLTMLKLGRERETLRVVNDQTGSPTSAAVIADATISILQKCRASETYESMRPFAGIYHLTCSGETTWFEFARAIFAEAQKLGLGDNLKVKEVVPISTAEYNAAARRPLYSVLSTEKFKSVFNFEPPHWSDVLPEVLRESRRILTNSSIEQ